MKSSRIWLVLGTVVSLSGSLRAADINDPNIFNPTGGPDATAVSSSTYGGVDLPTYAVDTGSGYNQFFFNDFAGEETLSISGFSAPSGIATLRFFDTEEYQEGRVATTVTIYASSTNYASSTSAVALNTANYTALNGGAAYTLPIGAGTDGAYYSTGVDSTGDNGEWGYYDDLAVNIPTGTQSLLFDFGNPGIGKGFTEIEAYAAAPEPSTYAMMFAGAALVAFCLRRKAA
jgi:hypothetical protein